MKEEKPISFRESWMAKASFLNIELPSTQRCFYLDLDVDLDLVRFIHDLLCSAQECSSKGA
jgi:hypothetical protein